MAELIYSAITSLDGYIEDEGGKFDWAEPDEEVHTFVNDLERPVGTYRAPNVRDDGRLGDALPRHAVVLHARVRRDLAGGRQDRLFEDAGDGLSSAKTRLERDFDSGAIRQVKASSERDLTVGGPELAGQAIRAGLVDEIHLFVAPVLVGGGKRSAPSDVRLELDLLDERRFGNGMVFLQYGTDG